MQIVKILSLAALLGTPLAQAKGPVYACVGAFYTVVSNILEEPRLQGLRVPLGVSIDELVGGSILQARKDLSIQFENERRKITFVNSPIVTSHTYTANFKLKISAKNAEDAWQVFQALVLRMDEHHPMKGFANSYSSYVERPGNANFMRIASGLYGIFDYTSMTLDLRMPPFGDSGFGGDIHAQGEIGALYHALLYSSDLRAGVRPVRGVRLH